MLAMMTATSIGMIPPLHNVRTAFGDDSSEERRRERRVRNRHEARTEHDRGRPELRRALRPNRSCMN